MGFDVASQFLYRLAMAKKKSTYDDQVGDGTKVAPNQDRSLVGFIIRPAAGAGKSRTIKYTGQGSALRAFVARTKAQAGPRPTIKLRAADPSPVRSKPQLADSLDAPPLVQEREAVLSPSERRSFVSSSLQLGEFVRNARLRQRMTQNMLAERAGTGRRFISELEAGKPTTELERVFQVCNALGLRLLAAEQDAG